MKGVESMISVNLGEETETIEYKKSTGEMKEAMISMAAILNKHGQGELFFGVKNDGTVIGQEVTDKTLREVSQAIGNHIKPVIYPEISKRTFDDSDVVYVKFQGSRQPYLAYNIPRIRVSDEDLVMDQDTYDELIRKRSDNTKSWEASISEYSVKDIDMDVLKNYIEKAKKAGRITFENEAPEAVMEKLGLISGDKLLNAGAALFCDKPLNELQMAKFASDERLTFTDIRRYTGSILELADKAQQYIVDAMDWKADIDGFEREERPEIPIPAIREAIINAFGHRLIESQQSVEVAIFKNRIEIFSPGVYASNIEPEEYIMLDKRSVRRNPIITRTLYYSKDMETFATGLRRIKKACDEAGCEVDFEKQENGFAVIFHRNLRIKWNDNQSINDKKTVKKTSKKTDKKTSKKTIAEISKKRDEILYLIGKNPRITINRLAEETGLSVAGVRYHLNNMKKQGVLERIGADKGGCWKVSDLNK